MSSHSKDRNAKMARAPLKRHLTLVDRPHLPSDRSLRLHFHRCLAVSVCHDDVTSKTIGSKRLRTSWMNWVYLTRPIFEIRGGQPHSALSLTPILFARKWQSRFSFPF